MTLIFWFIAGFLVLLALLIVLLPLWRTKDIAIADDLDQRNINIARDRLAELKANKAAGGINQAQYDEQVAELEIALSDDLELASSAVETKSQGKWLAYVLAIVIPVLSVGLYWTLGDYQAIALSSNPDQAAQSDPKNAGMPDPEAINQMVARLAEKLKSEPNNLEGWLMLGRSYKMLTRYSESVEAFAHAYQLAGENADVVLPYAEALALANKSDWSGKPKELVMAVLAKEPDNLTGIWFAAMINAQQGDKKTAVTYLKKLETLLPADSPDKQEIRNIIANTENELGNPKPVTGKKAEDDKKPSVSVSVQVSLAQELAKEIQPNDTVFIYAQALSGPKMPLAIIRKQVGELPLTTLLSDADSMMPNMKLSNFNQVRLLARISKSGSAMPQPGDLIGTIEQINLNDTEVHKIVINDQIK